MSTAPQLAGETSSGPLFWAADPPQLSIDPNGNLTSKTEGNDTWTYEWNAENQLTRVLKNGTEVARYAYDPNGRRVEKVAGGSTKTYTYDGFNILREKASPTTYALFIHGPDIDEPLAAEDQAGVRTYLHPDGLGSIVRHSDATGTATSTLRYDAFGIVQLGTPGPFGYTGREWDSEAGLHYYRERYLDAGSGRFISSDPIGFEGGINFYAYVLNNPVNFRDPLGLWPFAPPQFPVPFGVCATKIYLKHRALGHNGRRWHCMASCEIATGCGLGGRAEAAAAGHIKEAYDVVRCLATGQGCESAAQGDDYDDNYTGRSCPSGTSCEDQCRNLSGQGRPGPLTFVPSLGTGAPEAPPMRGGPW